MKPLWAVNQLALKAEMGRWIQTSIKQRHQNRLWSGGHDEGTFTSTWDGYYLLTGDENVFAFKQRLRDEFWEYARTHLYHGYYKTGEPHHQTETYNHFLGPFALLTDRDRPKNLAILEHAAHHLGNWVEGIPEWFDWEHKRFKSWSIGTQKVDESKSQTFEVLDHFRFAHMALDTYRAGGDERYLEFAEMYSDRWLDIILDKGMVPGALFPDAESERVYLSRRGQISGMGFVSQVHRIDGSGMADVFLTLYRLTGKGKYIDGIRVAFDQLRQVNLEHKTYSEMQPRIMAKYRTFTGDTSYDQWALDWLNSFELPDGELECRLILDGLRMSWQYRLPDNVVKEGGMPPEALLVLCYQITGDEAYLDRALDMGTKKLRACQLLRDGREHGCDSRTISGVSRVSAAPLFAVVLGATLGFRSNIDTVQVKYFKPSQITGLPEGVAALFEPTALDERCVHFYNDTEEEQVVQISIENTDLQVGSIETQACVQLDGELPAFRLPANGLAHVMFQLK
jgi:hypothetical protein